MAIEPLKLAYDLLHGCTVAVARGLMAIEPLKPPVRNGAGEKAFRCKRTDGD